MKVLGEESQGGKMGVKILSLFDGMACGMIAMQLAGVDVESYDAYEIDKYAIKTAQHNFPMIKEHGDVFDADFTQYEGVDFLIGGSPCTYWSIAQTKNRETVASGMGWELFSQYVRALKEAKPKYFIYENNKSMSKAIRASIDDAFGFEAVLINSALVSAQNRQRLYWVGRRNEDGTYSKVNVEQPADRGILLKDVLDNAVAMREKAHTIDANYYKGGNFTSPNKQSGKRLMAAEPLVTTKNGKSFAITANYVHIQDYPNDYAAHTIEKSVKPLVAEPINVTADGKAHTLKAQYYKNGIANFVSNDGFDATAVIEPINDILQVGAMPRPDGKISTSAGFRVYSTEAKGRYLCANGGGAGAKTGLYAIPTMPVKEATAKGYTEIECGDCVDLSMPNSKTRRGRSKADKANCMQTSNDFYQYVGYVIEFDDEGRPIKAIGKDGKEITIYEVTDGKITIKGKQYPIKLKDGYYIIRKLTVRECMRLQTVPEWYEFPVSNSQAYKMLGNGWTCEVICHLINSCFKPADVLPGQIGLWG